MALTVGAARDLGVIAYFAAPSGTQGNGPRLVDPGSAPRSPAPGAAGAARPLLSEDRDGDLARLQPRELCAGRVEPSEMDDAVVVSDPLGVVVEAEVPQAEK